MRLRASPVLLGGASLLFLDMPRTRGLLPGPSAPHRLERVPSSSSRSQHRRSSAGCLCRRHMAVDCRCFSSTNTYTNSNAHAHASDGAAAAAAASTTAAVEPSMRTACDPYHRNHKHLHHQEDSAATAAAAAAAASKPTSVLRRKQAEPRHQQQQQQQQQQQRPSKLWSGQFSRPRAINRRHAGRGILETSTSVGGGDRGGGGKAAANALGAASRARRGGSRAVRGGRVEREVGGGGNEEEGGRGERRMGGVMGVGSHSAFQNMRESVAGLPRLSRQEEMSLANDVRRWQRLERVREEVSRQETGAKGGGRDGGVGVEAWAMAAGMSVTDLRHRVEKGAGARERLVLSHVRLVMYLARRRGWSTALSPMDLVQEGTIALHAAADKYDPTRGVRFFTYADWALRAAFEQAEADQSGAVPLPRYVHVQKRRLRAVIRQETALRLRTPTREELATALDITEAQVGRLLRWLDGCDSTDRPLTTGGSLGEMLPGPNAFEADMRRLDAEAELGRLLGELKPQEEQVILHRYGLFGRGRKSTLAIAAVMGVSRQYVGRVHQSALVKMRVSFEEKSSSSRGTSSNSNSGSSSNNTSSSSSSSSSNSNDNNSISRENVFKIYTRSADDHHQQSQLQLEPELGR